MRTRSTHWPRVPSPRHALPVQRPLVRSASRVEPQHVQAVASQPELVPILVAEVDELSSSGADGRWRGAIPDECVRPGRLKPTLRTCPSATSTRRGGQWHHTLVERAVADAAQCGHTSVALGTNRANSTRRPSTNAMDSVVIPPAPSMLAASPIRRCDGVISRVLTAGNSPKRARCMGY